MAWAPARRPRTLIPLLALGVLGFLAVAATVLHTTIPLAQAAPPSQATRVSWLRAEGNRLVDEAGRTVVLRGVNLENREWTWAFSKSIEFEKRAIAKVTGAPPEGWGANVILLAVASGPVNRGDATYLAFLDDLVARAKANGAYTLLVYRYSEPNSEQPPMPDEAAEDAMAALAARYADEPAVLYGLQVEPHNVTWSHLKPRFTSMIDAIRARNPRALIAVPGTHWGRHIHWALSDPIARPNLMYKTHPYDSWGTISASYRLGEVAARYPVILGEFGAGSMMGLDDVRSLLDFAEGKGMSWVGWTFHDRGCPCMLSDASTFATTQYGEEVRQRLQAAYSPGPTPTQSPTPTATPPATPSPGATLAIYDDRLHWQDWSWRTTVDAGATSPVLSGSHAMAVTFTSAWAGLSLHTAGVDTTPYTHLTFAVHFGGRPPGAITAALYDASGAIIRQVPLGAYVTPGVDGWLRVSIPLAELGGTRRTITRVQLQEAAGGAQPTFYVDELRLADLSTPAPTPAPTPTSTPSPTPPPTPSPTPSATPEPGPLYLEGTRSGTCDDGQVWTAPVPLGSEGAFPAPACVSRNWEQGTAYLRYPGYHAAVALVRAEASEGADGMVGCLQVGDAAILTHWADAARFSAAVQAALLAAGWTRVHPGAWGNPYLDDGARLVASSRVVAAAPGLCRAMADAAR